MVVKGLDISTKNKKKFKNKTVYNMEVKGQRKKNISWAKTKEALLYLVNVAKNKHKKFIINVNALLPTGDITLIGGYLSYNGEDFEDNLDNYEEYLDGKVKDVDKFLTASMLSISFIVKNT